MTRINADIEPCRLTDQHLLAEYNEMAMVYASLRRSRNAQSDDTLLKRIPMQYTLNGGHVLFFYNKLTFLGNRYQALIDELKHRGYNLDPNRSFTTPGEFPEYFYNDWKASGVDRKIIIERIVERINRKPAWYKYYGKQISDTFIAEKYGE